MDGDSLARPLGGDGMPVEPPEPIRVRSAAAARGRWLGLAAFAIVGSTGILIVSGLGDVHGSVENASRHRDKLLDVPIDPNAPAESGTVYAVEVDGLPAIGRSDAKVTLVAVTDYSCTNCEVARSIVLGLRGSYGDDLRIVWKPLVREPTTMPVQVGACAAALQGEFERFDDAVWRAGPDRAGRTDRPVELPNGRNPDCVDEMHGCGEVVRTARDLGLDGARFVVGMKRCVPTVMASQRELEALHVLRPAFFVNGRMVDPWGTETAAAFQNLIDVELAKARRRIAAGATAARYYEQFVLDVGQRAR